MTSPPAARDLAAVPPDEPRWIDLRGLLLTGRCETWAEADPARGFVARSWDYPFAAVYGAPRPERIAAAAAAGRAAFADREGGEEWQLIAAPASRPAVEAALPKWRRRGIVVHRWRGDPGRPLPAAGAEIRLLPDGHRGSGLPLDEVPAASRRELALDWVSRRPMAVAMVGSRPVSFCYAAFVTESLWDVAVETLAPFRRQGLAGSCFSRLAAHMAGKGRTPTWGAMEDNPASLGLAAKLGFVPDATLDGWAPAS